MLASVSASDSESDSESDSDSDSDSGVTPLIVACENGHVDAARLLLEKGADVHKATNRKRTPLHGVCDVWRCRDCHIEVARLLLANGADVDRKDGEARHRW